MMLLLGDSVCRTIEIAVTTLRPASSGFRALAFGQLARLAAPAGDGAELLHQ
jgi:hypothetical protein